MPLPHLAHVAQVTDAQKRLMLLPRSAEAERICSVIIWGMAKRIREARALYFDDPKFIKKLEQSKLVQTQFVESMAKCEREACKMPQRRKVAG